MAEPIAAPTTDTKTIAGNIANGITDKANGKAPAAPPINKQEPPINPSAKIEDPNAGKEKYVVEGKEVWLTAEQARAYVQKGLAFEPKVDQLNRLQRETQQFLSDLKNNPAKILFDKRLGHTPETVFENIMGSAQISDAVKEKVGRWYYQNVVEPLQLTPEQLKAREDAKWRTERERQDAAARDLQIKAENQRRFEEALGQLKANIAEAMKDSGLPDNNTPLGSEMARMVADVMRVAKKQQKAITPKQAIEYVKQRIKSVQAAYYESLAEREDDGETLVKELGEKTIKRIQTYLLKQAKSNGAGAKPPVVPNGKPAVRNGERKNIITPDEFREQLEEIKRRG